MKPYEEFNYFTHQAINKVFKMKNISKYKSKINNKEICCTIFKSANKYEFDFPTSFLFIKDKRKNKLNVYFSQYLKKMLYSHYEIFYPLISSINYKLIIICNNNKEIIDVYYKIAFFADNKTTVLRYFANDMVTESFLDNASVMSIHQMKLSVVKNLYNIELNQDFIFDIDGLNVIKMLII